MSDESNPYAAPRAEAFEHSDSAESKETEAALFDVTAEFGRASRWLTISLPVTIFAAFSFGAFGLTMLLTTNWSRLILDGTFSLLASGCLGVLAIQLLGARRAIERLRRQQVAENLFGVVAKTRNVFVTTTLIAATLTILGFLYLIGEVLGLDWQM